ncbi:MAG TPA: cyclic nucleotide-binding domain-containing protein, partial [Xanthobacteraceae bacterium]
MNLEHPDLVAILLHVADQGAQSGVVTHLLTQLGLDPNEVTVGEVVHRLEGAAWAAINLANVFALLGALFYVATLLMRTIVPLRVSALISCAF